MRVSIFAGAGIVLLLCGNAARSQQLKLGKNPFVVEKSAVLELNSDNQGLLLARISDTTSINALSPPDGMMIYYTPAKKILLRVNGAWQSMTLGAYIASLNGLTPAAQTFAIGTSGTNVGITSTGSTHTFNFPDASASARGLVTTGAQTFAGAKTLTSSLTVSAANPLTLSGVAAGTSTNADSILTITSGLVRKIPMSTFTSSPTFSSLTPGSIPFISTGGVLSQNNAALFWDSVNKRIGIGTNTPAADLTVLQGSGATTTRGIRLAGNSISGNNAGTGFGLALGYNITNNKQLWLGDADYFGNNAGVFVRYSATNGVAILDAVSGDNANRRPIRIGVGNDNNSTILLGDDGGSSTPASYIYSPNNMAIGPNFRASAAPTNGLLVQGNTGIGSNGFNSTFPEKLLVDAGTTTSVNVIGAKGTINNYLQLNIQNLSSGNNASSDIVATADNGSETTNFVDMGINSSTNNAQIFGNPNDAYLYNLGNNLLIGTGSSGKSLIFMTGGVTQSTNERMRIDGNGKLGINTTTPAAQLDAAGTIKLGANGTVNKNVISYEFVLSSATAVSSAVLSLLALGGYTAGGVTLDVAIPVASQPTTTRGSVSVSFDQDLPAGVSVAWARVTSVSNLRIRFSNSNTSATSLPSGMKCWITINEF